MVCRYVFSTNIYITSQLISTSWVLGYATHETNKIHSDSFFDLVCSDRPLYTLSVHNTISEISEIDVLSFHLFHCFHKLTHHHHSGIRSQAIPCARSLSLSSSFFLVREYGAYVCVCVRDRECVCERVPQVHEFHQSSTYLSSLVLRSVSKWTLLLSRRAVKYIIFLLFSHWLKILCDLFISQKKCILIYWLWQYKWGKTQQK